ncbi:MAG: NAD(P)H-dependent oxidoreductase subunit E [Oligoflexales bacterium]|nr:NAD(P)H-dependent oxidoreductase subunit E [Oligoflexales bacterium]
MALFSAEIKLKIEALLGRYETRRSAILPILHVIQDEYGWIQPEHFDALHKDYDLDRVQVYEVATFYSMYRLKEPKPYRILFCDNIVCHMMGAKSAMATIEKKLEAFKVKTGQEAPFSLDGVPCLGVCDGAPAMLVNKDRYLCVSDEKKIDEILAKYSGL